jgi:hypothetical protein
MTKCIVSGCENPANSSRGMCHKHYKRWQVHGHTALTSGKGCDDPKERLALQSKRTESGCLEWTGTISKSGYGQTKWNYKFYTVHRLAWTLANGPIPKGMCVCHRCDNRKCFDVTHLFLGTHADNAADRCAKNRDWNAIGENTNTAKLSLENAAFIASAKEPVEELAARYGLALSTVYRIKNGQYWRRALQANQRRGNV